MTQKALLCGPGGLWHPKLCILLHFNSIALNCDILLLSKQLEKSVTIQILYIKSYLFNLTAQIYFQNRIWIIVITRNYKQNKFFSFTLFWFWFWGICINFLKLDILSYTWWVFKKFKKYLFGKKLGARLKVVVAYTIYTHVCMDMYIYVYM